MFIYSRTIPLNKKIAGSNTHLIPRIYQENIKIMNHKLRLPKINKNTTPHFYYHLCKTPNKLLSA